jgi:peptidylprolyl isomerase
VKLLLARTGLTLLAAALAVAGCSSGSKAPASGSDVKPASGAVAGAAAGVTVTGAFGAKPTLSTQTSAPPTKLGVTVATTGKGAKVANGQVLIARQFAQTWAVGKAKPVLVGDSYVSIPIGNGQALTTWNRALIGQRVGSRVVLAVPGTAGATAKTPLAGQPMMMVFDLLAVIPADAAAKGTSVAVHSPQGLPTIKSSSGAAPTSPRPARRPP